MWEEYDEVDIDNSMGWVYLQEVYTMSWVGQAI